MCGLRSRSKRSPAYVMLTFPRLLVFSLLLCSTLPWTRCARLRTTLLFSGPCIHQRFLGSLRRGRSRLGPRLPPLLIVAAPPLGCLGRRCRRRRLLPLPMPSRVERGGDAKVRRPIRRPPAAPVATERVPGRSPPDGVPPLLRVGVACQRIGGTGKLLELNPGCCLSWGMDISSPSRTLLPNIVSNISGRISSVTGFAPGSQEDLVQGCLGSRPRSGSRLLQSSFPGGKGDGGLVSRDRPLSPERVCSANSVQDGDHRLCAPVHPWGRFPSFRRPDWFVFPNTQSSGLEEALEVPVGWGNLPVRGPVLWDCQLPPSSLPGCFAAVSAWVPSHGVLLLRYLNNYSQIHPALQ